MEDHAHETAGVSAAVQGFALDTARQAAPWREGQSWWFVGLEGLVALGVGIFAATQPESANGIIRQLIALILLVVSLGQILDGFRFRQTVLAPWSTTRGGAGATIALLTLLSPLSDTLAGDGGREILGYGLVVFALLGVAAALLTRDVLGFKWGTLIGDTLTLVLGLYLVFRPTADASGTMLLAWIMILGGVALLAFAALIWSRGRADDAQPAR